MEDRTVYMTELKLLLACDYRTAFNDKFNELSKKPGVKPW